MISSRARIGLRGGERVGFGTVSTTVARSFNGEARSSSQVKVLVRLRYANNLTTGIPHVPAELERFTRFPPDLDGDMRTTRGHVPIQSA